MNNWQPASVTSSSDSHRQHHRTPYNTFKHIWWVISMFHCHLCSENTKIITICSWKLDQSHATSSEEQNVWRLGPALLCPRQISQGKTLQHIYRYRRWKILLSRWLLAMTPNTFYNPNITFFLLFRHVNRHFPGLRRLIGNKKEKTLSRFFLYTVFNVI